MSNAICHRRRDDRIISCSQSQSYSYHHSPPRRRRAKNGLLAHRAETIPPNIYNSEAPGHAENDTVHQRSRRLHRALRSGGHLHVYHAQGNGAAPQGRLVLCPLVRVIHRILDRQQASDQRLPSTVVRGHGDRRRRLRLRGGSLAHRHPHAAKALPTGAAHPGADWRLSRARARTRWRALTTSRIDHAYAHPPFSYRLTRQSICCFGRLSVTSPAPSAPPQAPSPSPRSSRLLAPCTRVASRRSSCGRPSRCACGSRSSPSSPASASPP